MITVTKKDETRFLVIVEDKYSRTEHTVELDNEYFQKLSKGKITRNELIKKSFEFLLKRESKESILSKFNLKEINRYFPEYEKEITP
jgi:hypothetical protein